ncbi:hypothetical protein [Streptomyces scabiei]|uniref:hypothetical protein n=1 Tax=Streptomyces scabiei TaxID=1930 RepID=UPI001F1B80C6|nr:hypothetical protein [Streptomyces scabiei]
MEEEAAPLVVDGQSEVGAEGGPFGGPADEAWRVRRRISSCIVGIGGCARPMDTPPAVLGSPWFSPSAAPIVIQRAEKHLGMIRGPGT